MPGYNASASAD